MNAITRPISPWTQLQTELRDLAFLLDRQGSHAAADLAVTVAARIDELLSDDSTSGKALRRDATGLMGSPGFRNTTSP